MNKVVCTLVTASVLVSGSAFGQDRSNSQLDKQSKHPLLDAQMDNVTAGSAIAVGNASVTNYNAGAISLSGGALSGATGVNIVNSSDSVVANGVNVYDSSLTTQASNGGAAVNQVNALTQSEKANANVAIAAQADPAIAIATANAANIAAYSAKTYDTSSNSVDLSGGAEQNATGIDIVNASGGMVANGVNIAHSANMNATPTLNQVNAIKQSGLTGKSAVAIYDAAVTTSTSGTVDLSGSALRGATGLNIVNSANSAVANGVNVYDSSLAYQDASKGSAVNQINAFAQTEKTNGTVQAAAAISAPLSPIDIDLAAQAKATNIAASNAKINTATNNSVDLAGTAEQNAIALNIVNSAGGMVSNGVNIAHSANMNAMPTLNQVNFVSQVR